MQVNILGTPYEIIVKKYDEDEMFKDQECDGYCASATHKIVLCDLHSLDRWKNETEETIQAFAKQTLRHEIVHAFFNESGLTQNTNSVDAWAVNEEMVDWIALQGEKIYKAWQEVNAL